MAGRLTFPADAELGTALSDMGITGGVGQAPAPNGREIKKTFLSSPPGKTPGVFPLQQSVSCWAWRKVASRCGPDALRNDRFQNAWWLHTVRGGENLALGALENPRCPSDILEVIYASALDEWQLDPDDIRQELSMMAGHPNASRDLLHKLFEIDDSLVKEQLANNVNCDAGLRDKVLTELNKEMPVPKKTRNQTKEKRAVKPKPATESTSSQNTGFRRFEFNDGKSSKFWSIRVSGVNVEVTGHAGHCPAIDS